jgi:hypothetical protein
MYDCLLRLCERLRVDYFLTRQLVISNNPMRSIDSFRFEQYPIGGITMKKICAAIGCAWVFSVSVAQGAEYFIYQDPAGRIVLSNTTPPPAAEVIKRYELQDVTDEEVRAAREREHAFWQRLKDEEIAESNRKLAESNYRLAQAIITAAALRDWEPDVVQVAVSDAFPFDGFHTGRLQQRGRLFDGFHTGRLPQRGHLNSGFRPHSRFR